MDKVREASDEEIDALNRDIERIFAGMPPEEAEAEELERRIADNPILSTDGTSKATLPTI